MRVKAVGVLATLLVALLAMSFAYAAWTETLQIVGTIETGEVNVCMDKAVSRDPLDTIDPGKDKDVGLTIIEGEDTDGDGSWEWMWIGLFNAYPSYETGVDFYVNNTGTIPVKIQSIKLIMVSNATGQISVDIDLAECTWYYVDADTGRVETDEFDGADFAIHFTHLAEGDQIDPGDAALADIEIHVLQDARELDSYDFAIEIVAIQWNEYVV